MELEPEHAVHIGNYANFLHHKGDYDKAESFYLKTLRLEPEHAVYNANYAIFLANIRKEYDKAESFYLKALVLEPNYASFNRSYALFLKNIHKNYDKAEDFYLKALELEPKHANYNGAYAQFLLETSRKLEADAYMETAFNYMTEENNLPVELWFYRLAHYPEFYEQAQQELDKLLAEGHKSIGWHFEGNIEQAKKDGVEDIKLLEKYAKKITEECEVS